MGRSPCCDKSGQKKGPWTPEEDSKLIEYIQMNGAGNWRTLPKNAGLQRCGKSCRLRWTNYLRPDIKRGRFSFEEEETIIQLHSVVGNKWSAIAARLPGRTDNEIKNYWNTHIRKRLLRMGIDPVTHAPRLDLSSSLMINSPQLINTLSNLLCLQSLLNPNSLSLALSLLSSSSSTNFLENPDDLLQKLQENQFHNSKPLLQSSHVPAAVQTDHHIENIMHQQIPPSSSSPTNCDHPVDTLSSDQSSQGNFMGQIFHHNLMLPSATSNHQSLPTNIVPSIWNGIPESFDNTSSHSMNSTSSNNNISNQNIFINYDSVLSTTPLSSPAPLMNNSASSGALIINGSSTETSTSSDMLRFEIPESLYFDEFMCNY